MTTNPTIAQLSSLVRSLNLRCYQRALVFGFEPWSGRGIRGRAANYAGGYARSRLGLIHKLNAASDKAFGEGRAVWYSTLVLNGSSRWERMLVVDVGGQTVEWQQEYIVPMYRASKALGPALRAFAAHAKAHSVTA